MAKIIYNRVYPFHHLSEVKLNIWGLIQYKDAILPV